MAIYLSIWLLPAQIPAKPTPKKGNKNTDHLALAKAMIKKNKVVTFSFFGIAARPKREKKHKKIAKKGKFSTTPKLGKKFSRYCQ